MYHACQIEFLDRLLDGESGQKRPHELPDSISRNGAGVNNPLPPRGGCVNPSSSADMGFGNALYYSTATSTTLGYDPGPEGAMCIAVALITLTRKAVQDLLDIPPSRLRQYKREGLPVCWSRHGVPKHRPTPFAQWGASLPHTRRACYTYAPRADWPPDNESGVQRMEVVQQHLVAIAVAAIGSFIGGIGLTAAFSRRFRSWAWSLVASAWRPLTRRVTMPLWSTILLALFGPILIVLAFLFASSVGFLRMVPVGVAAIILIIWRVVERTGAKDGPRQYTQDEFVGATWRWSYPDDGTDEIVDLRAFCPKCQMELPCSAAPYSGERHTQLVCDNCGTKSERIAGDGGYALSLVRRKILRCINTGEWRQKIAHPDGIGRDAEDYRKLYTKDTIRNVTWRWGYANNRIINLRPFCPKCDMELTNVRADQGTHEWTELHCEGHECGFVADGTWEDMNHAQDVARREIERNIRTGEWKKRIGTSDSTETDPEDTPPE